MVVVIVMSFVKTKQKKQYLQNTNVKTITITIFETLKTHIIKFSGCKETFNN